MTGISALPALHCTGERDSHQPSLCRLFDWVGSREPLTVFGSMDPLTYAGVAVVLGLAGVIACMMPAWRASGTNPMNALRME
jgi:hypothetical protein